MNRELFKKVDDLLSAEESLLSMATWEQKNGDGARATSCGTTRCMAGWGIFLTTGAQIWMWKQSEHGNWQEMADYSPEFVALANRLGTSLDIPDVAGRLFGLLPSEEDAFYLQDHYGREFIRLAAQGRDAEARQILRDYRARNGL